jgi:hypothetical protein
MSGFAFECEGEAARYLFVRMAMVATEENWILNL